MKYDVIVIGGGIVGSAILHELSKYNLKSALLEKEEDVCSGTSKANSAIVHAGFDAKCETLKAKLNVEGAKMIKELAPLLHFSYLNNGAMVLCFDKEKEDGLKELYDRGVKNGVKDLKIIDGDTARKIEPHLSNEVCSALLAPTSGIVCPFEMTIAFGENAVLNGAEIFLNEEVKTIERKDGCYLINDKFETKAIINAAGVYGDKIHNLLYDDGLKLTVRKGDYCLFDREAGNLVSHTLFQLPTKLGKGVLVTPTVHGNLLLGPSASDIEDKEYTATSKEDLDLIIEKGKLSVDKLPMNKVITSFAGLRARPATDDFIIRSLNDGYYEAIGIESPGLSSAPAIAKMLVGEVVKDFDATENKDFGYKRKGIVKVSSLSKEERMKLIKEKPLYGNIICRCEEVSEQEIIDAINSPIRATSLDAIKRRVRAQMGRCQGGFCGPKIMEILARELKINVEDVTKNNSKSKMLVGKMGEL